MHDLRTFLAARNAGPLAAPPVPAPSATPAAPAPAPAATPAPAPTAPPGLDAAAQAEIVRLCGIAERPELAADFAAAGLTPAQVSNLLVSERARASDAVVIDWRGGHNATSMDSQTARIAAKVDALCARLDGTSPTNPAARQFLGETAAEIFGVAPRLGQAFGGAMTSSDFPLLAGEFVQRRARMAYAAAPAALKAVARQELLDNFLPNNILAAGQFPRLQALSEHAAVKHGTIEEESGQVLQLYTVGVIVAVLRQLIVNDNLRLIDQRIQRAAASAALTEADALAAVINAPGNWSDGNPLFDASHGNIASAPNTGAINVAALSEAVQSIRLQRDVDQQTYLSLAPTHLVVSPWRETEARQILAEISPAAVEDVNPFTRSLQLVVEPRLEVGSPPPWYVAAAGADGLLYGYLRDAPGPQVAVEPGFDYDGTRVRVLLDFAVTWADFRPWFQNPGA